jgi:pSer/pThr/pTyr-binding forkhead associated (FHA) protein
MDLGALLMGGVVGAAASIVTAFTTAQLTARHELRKWRVEAAEKYAELVSEDPRKAQAFATQFAVGVLVLEWTNSHEREKIFVPPNARMIAGRGACEIQLRTHAASRQHFAISTDSRHVYIEDLGSSHGVWVNDLRVDRRRTQLRTGDTIQVGNANDAPRIEFQELSTRF